MTSGTRTRPGRRLAVLRAGITILLIAGTAWLFSQLRSLDPSPPAMGSVRDPDGTTLCWIDDGPNRPIRVILSRKAVELDPYARRIRIGDEARILPRTPTLIIDAGGQMESIGAPVPSSLLDYLRLPAGDSIPPLTARLEEARVRRAFEEAGILLLRFHASS